MNIIIEEIVSEIPVLITEEVFQITIADATSYFDLIEVADTDFVGKDGFVPVVDEATGKLVLQEQQSGPVGGLQLGETSSTAYRGDRGKTAYDHSQATGNPHGTTPSQIGAYSKTETDNLLNDKFDVPSGDNTQYLDGVGNPITFPTIPTTATEVDALKRDGSNASADLDLGAFRLKAGELVTQTLGSTKLMALKGNNLDGEYTAEWQPKNYDGIADITDIPTTLAQLGTDSENQRVSTVEKASYSAKIDEAPNDSNAYVRSALGWVIGYTKTAIDNLLSNINTDTARKDTVKLSENISKGQAVYISSANGTNIIVSKASNTTEATSSKVLGLLETTGITNDIVKVINDGPLSGLNTSSATIGDAVWLGVNGNLIYGLANKPVAPAHLVYIGIVSRVSATVGEIIVKVQNGFELSEIHDVLLTSKTNEDFLQYNSTTGLWKNFQISVAWLRSKLDSIYTTSSAVATQISNALTSYVPTTRTVNGKALSTNISISASDVGAPSGSGSSTGVNTGDQDLSGLVPTTRTVNGKALSVNITLSASDVGAPTGSGNSIGTNTGDQDLSGLATKVMGAYSFRVNNTNATANSTEKTYKSLGKQTYSLSPTWTGTTAPITPNHSYSIQIVDNFCKGSIWLVYGTAGTSVSQVVIPFTSDMPNPVNPNGLATALDIIGVCTATMRGSNNSTVLLLINGFIRINSAGTGYEFVVIGNAAGYKNVLVSFEYPTS